jgi:hypothetical protein
VNPNTQELPMPYRPTAATSARLKILAFVLAALATMSAGLSSSQALAGANVSKRPALRRLTLPPTGSYHFFSRFEVTRRDRRYLKDLSIAAFNGTHYSMSPARELLTLVSRFSGSISSQGLRNLPVTKALIRAALNGEQSVRYYVYFYDALSQISQPLSFAVTPSQLELAREIVSSRTPDQFVIEQLNHRPHLRSLLPIEVIEAIDRSGRAN